MKRRARRLLALLLLVPAACADRGGLNLTATGGLRGATALVVEQVPLDGQPASVEITGSDLRKLVEALDVSMPLHARSRCPEAFRLTFRFSGGSTARFGYSCESASFLRGEQDYWRGMEITPPGAFDELLGSKLPDPGPTPVPTPAPTRSPTQSPTPEPTMSLTPSPRPSPSLTPPVAAGKFIEISLERQELIAWNGPEVVMRFPVSTGRPGYRTPAGRFKILSKARMGWSRAWGVYMPWMMQFYGNYTIHELPHYPGGPPIGASQLGTAASHGCVRVGVGNAERLYRWTPLGTPVWLH